MGHFKRLETTLQDVFIIEPAVYRDSRGYFCETYQEEAFKEMGIRAYFVQDNESLSEKGVLRGMHFQTVMPQGKLVSVAYGEVFDVAVDLRVGSPTYGKWEGFILSGENHRLLYIPEGFAHGFLTLSDQALFRYKCTAFYAPQFDSGICWCDETVGIKWPLEKVEVVKVSEKDEKLQSFESHRNHFVYRQKEEVMV